MDFDLAPTMRLAGLHYRGTVDQRVIANYPVAPDLLKPFVPKGARLWVKDGIAWLSACFVQMSNVRPAGVPKRLGLSFRYLVVRTMVEVVFPDGKVRKAVLVLEAYGDPAVPRMLGRVLGGAPFRPARIEWTHDGGKHQVRATDKGGLLYEASSREGFSSRAFGLIADADAAILGMAWGSHHDGGWRFFPETHDPWNAHGLTVTTTAFAFRDRLGLAVEADHAIAMEDCPHYFGRPVKA